MTREQRRLAAIVSADVVEYARLMGADEAGTLQALRAHRRQLIDPKIAAHGGRIVKTMGDGLLLEFPSVVEAVRCAVEMQAGMAARNLEEPEERRISFRVGINLGDIIIEGDDIFGDGVNVAARIEALATPGGICISRSARDQVRDRLEIELEDMGEVEVKNIARPIRVFRVRTEAPAPAPAAEAAPVSPDKPSIAVLPFENMSGDPEQEYFSDGITEDIITDLSKLSGLFVIARNSAFVYKGKRFNVAEVCRELGVKFALEGSVRKAGNRVRISAQLIDGASGGHLWAERFDRDLTDIFEVQDEVAQRIVGALKVSLSESEKALLADAGTRNVEAHDLFMRGRELVFGQTKDRRMFDEATDIFRRAIELDPNYSGPYAGMAMVYQLDHQNHWSDAPEQSLARAVHFAGVAVAKGENDPFAHYVAALTAMFSKDYERWAGEADKALALNPNFALALNARALVHIYTGEPLEGIPIIERAMRLDPAFQQQYLHFLGTAYLMTGQYETAAVCFKQRIVLTPKSDLSRAFLVVALGHLGRADEAQGIWRELMEINPDYRFDAHIARLPFKHPADAERFGEGLRMVGLPEA